MKKINAFTMLELIVAIGMSVMVISGLGAIFAGTIKVWSRIQDTGSALKEARLAMDWLVRDIKAGTLQGMGSNFIKLSTANYPVPSGYILIRNTDTVAKSVTPLYTYYDQDGNLIILMPSQDLSKVSTVTVRLAIQRGGTTFYLTSGAHLRTSVSQP